MKQTLLTASLIIACCLWGASAAQAAVISGSYTGDGLDNKAINLGFQPAVVIVKDSRDFATGADPAQIRTKDMATTSEYGRFSGNTSGTDRIKSLSSTGFTLGTSTVVNTSGRLYYYFAFSTVAGEIVVNKYTGTGSSGLSVTGLGFQPAAVFAFGLNRQGAFRTSGMSGDMTGTWEADVFTGGITSLTADGFVLGNNAQVNSSGEEYYYFACKEVAGKFKASSYVGDGVDDRQITGVGFQPECFFVKRQGTTVGQMKFASTGVSAEVSLSSGLGGFATNRIQKILPDGFEVGSTGPVNVSAATYHYFAWAGVAAGSSGVQPLGTASQQFATNNTLSSYTVPAGTNRLLVVSAGDPSTPTNPATVTFGGTPMSLANSTSDGFISCDSIWYLPLGTGADVTGNIVVSFTGTLKRHISAAAFSGVSQTSPVDLNGPKVSGSITGSNLAASLDVTSEAGDRVFDVVDAFNSTMIPTTTVGANQTLINTVGDNFGSNFYARYSTSHEAGAATVNMSWATQATAILHLTTNINQVGSAVSAPTVTSTAAASVMATTATLGGNITATGGEDATARGVVYALTSANANPEIGGASVTVLPESGTFSTGAFTRSATSLTASSAYSFKAYATNSSGTSYGSVLTFNTSAAPVSVSSLNTANSTPTNAATVNWTLTFASAVTGVTASNFSLSGAGAIGASVGTPTTSNAGLTWTVPVTTAADGTLTLSLANATGLSATIGSLPYAGQSYEIDKTAPTVLSVVRQTPSGQMTTATSVTFRVTYSEPVTGIAAGRYKVAAVNGSNIVGTVTGVTPVSTSIYDVAVSITSGTGEFRLRVID